MAAKACVCSTREHEGHLCASESRDNIPLEADKPVEFLLENALLIAVRTKTLWSVFDIDRRINAVARALASEGMTLKR